ncbi:MAG: hypothetical protein ABI123_00575 [Ginsengibacter sp.]|jgi:Sec-independent protein translocase protein TatA
MNILKLAGQIFLIYLLYKLIVEFIIPVYKSTKNFKKQFSEMQSKMKEQMNSGQQSQQAPPQPEVTTKVEKEGDYIEFEEIDSKQ